MSEIKKGDLVMVVRGTPCCGNTKNIGIIFIAGDSYSGPAWPCTTCGENLFIEDAVWVPFATNQVCEKHRLIRLDPPATGETREAYRNLKLPKKVTA